VHFDAKRLKAAAHFSGMAAKNVDHLTTSVNPLPPAVTFIGHLTSASQLHGKLMATRQSIKIHGKTLALSNLEKPLYLSGFTRRR
jgi:hypothetical protein